MVDMGILSKNELPLPQINKYQLFHNYYEAWPYRMTHSTDQNFKQNMTFYQTVRGFHKVLSMGVAC